MKVIDLFNKMANGEEIPKKIKIYDDIYEYDEFYQDYISIEDDDKLIESYILFTILNDEIEIIKESKEELEEIELLRDGVHFLGVDLKVNEIIFKEKINELIANQNKIIRELKANKKQ